MKRKIAHIATFLFASPYLVSIDQLSYDNTRSDSKVLGVIFSLKYSHVFFTRWHSGLVWTLTRGLFSCGVCMLGSLHVLRILPTVQSTFMFSEAATLNFACVFLSVCWPRDELGACPACMLPLLFDNWDRLQPRHNPERRIRRDRKWMTGLCYLVLPAVRRPDTSNRLICGIGKRKYNKWEPFSFSNCGRHHTVSQCNHKHK